MTRKSRVLFLCVHNSARSQMAEGILRHLAGDRYEVASAGSQPTAVHPLAVAAMAERGVDLSGHRSKDVRELLGQAFDFVFALCGDEGEVCPFVPGARVQEHVPFPDPSAEGTLDAFRRVRDDLWRWIAARFLEGGS